MILGLGITIYGTRGGQIGPAPADPLATLAALGTSASVLRPWEIGTLFQISDGTTPVTTAGDPVGRFSDTFSENHLKQTTAAARATFQTTDYPHVAGSGVGQWLVADTFSLTDTFVAVYAVKYEGGAGTFLGLHADDAGGSRSVLGWTGTNWTFSSVTGITSGVDNSATHILTVICDGTNVSARFNGVDQGISAAIPASSGARKYALMSRENDRAANALQGRIGGAVLVAGTTGTTEAIAAAEAYLADKVGVTL